MCNIIRSMNLKRANNALRRHLKSSSFVYAFFGSGMICWSNSEHPKMTFLVRSIQATIIMHYVQKYVLIVASSSKYWRDRLNAWVWLGVMSLNTLKIFAMFVSGFREQGLIPPMINDLVKTDRAILEYSTKKSRRSWLYSHKLYLLDVIGFIFLGAYHVTRFIRRDVSSFVDIIFFVKSICILMHSSFCKYVFVTFSLFRNVNDQCRALSVFSLSQVRTIQAIRILTVQHRSILRVWNKLMHFYEPYLFFQVLNIFFDMMYVIKKVYSYYIHHVEPVGNLQIWHVFLVGLWSLFEILSICVLCTKVAVEGNKTGIIMHDLTTDKSFSYLSSEISYVFEYMERGSLSCTPYGIFTINNRLFYSLVANLLLLTFILFCTSHF